VIYSGVTSEALINSASPARQSAEVGVALRLR